jgi:transposase InsO family protein
VRLVEHKVLVHLSEEEKNRDTKLWVLDTGAMNHMSGARLAFAELNTAVRGTVSFGDGSVANIEGYGTVLFNCKNDEHRSFAGVYYIPRLTSNIISIGQLDEAGYKVNIEDGVLRIREQSRKLLARVSRRPDRLYVLELDVARPVCLAARGKEESWRWHSRMGHVNMNALRKMAREELVRGLPQIEQVDQLCDACLAGKQRRSSFPTEAQYRAERTLELVHEDLCGPITPETPSGGKYFLLLVDDKSRFMWLKVLARKNQAAAVIKEFQARAEVESGKKLGVLRTDRGGEFTSVEFAEYCTDEGVRRQLTAPYSPQQNGVVERRNGTVVATARSMLKAKGLSGWFW